MQCMNRRTACRGAQVERATPTRLSVRAQAASETAPFKLPTKAPLPKDAEGVKSMIAKSHEMHGQGRSLWFSLSGPGKRATTGTYLAHADNIDWQNISSGSMDSYNIYS